MKYCVLLSCLLMVRPSHEGLLFWSQRSIQIPALKHFSNFDLLELTRELDHPKIIAFRTELIENVSRCFQDMHSAYVPNSDLDLNDLSDVNATVFNEVAEVPLFRSCNKMGENVLFLQMLPDLRSKRDLDATKNGTSSFELLDKVPKGPVLYGAEGTVMIYSAQPPLLKINNNSLVLGKSVSAIIAKSEGTIPHKLILSVTAADGSKVILRFRFSSHKGYWSLTAVEVQIDALRYFLNITKAVEAPARFSYHCSGETVFRNATNNIELILYALQVQPDSKNNRFGDAIDCVPFVTVPILSGLFITFTLIIGLFIGLGALGSIKSMDKFENCKTKQLSIALAD